MANIVLLGGTPGTGKTETANALSAAFAGEVAHLGEIALQTSLTKGFDAKRKTRIVDPVKMNKWIRDFTESKIGWIFLESHYIELVSVRPIQGIFILRTNPAILRNRLANRGWSESKILENVQAETLGVCVEAASRAFGCNQVVEVDTSASSPDETATAITEVLRNESKHALAAGKRYDWLTQLSSEELAAVFP